MHNTINLLIRERKNKSNFIYFIFLSYHVSISNRWGKVFSLYKLNTVSPSRSISFHCFTLSLKGRRRDQVSSLSLSLYILDLWFLRFANLFICSQYHYRLVFLFLISVWFLGKGRDERWWWMISGFKWCEWFWFYFLHRHWFCESTLRIWFDIEYKLKIKSNEFP